MRHFEPELAGQPWLALKYQCLARGQPGGGDKQILERRMCFVSVCVRQRHVEGRNQLDIQRLIAQIAQLHLAELDIVLRADPNRGVRLQRRPGGIKTHPVGVKHTLVVGRRIGCRMLGDRINGWLAELTQVDKTAALITQGIVAAAVDTHLAPTAGPCPIGAQLHAVATITQHMGRLNRNTARHHLAQQARQMATLRLRRQAGGLARQTGDFTGHAFMQQ